jgi:type I restriction enzyme S subunit
MIENTLIPKNWKINRLDEVGDIVSGGTPSTKEVDNWGEEIIWITPSDLTGYLAKTIFKGKKSISKLGLSRSSARLMPKGSVLFSSRAPIGYVVIAGTELCTNQGFKSIIPNEKVTSDYLFHFLKYSKTHVQSIASGTTFKEISARAFGSLKMPVPPLKEQHLIVEKIEELFSELDAGRRLLETVKEQLKTYRQAVLKYAFHGKLTNKSAGGGEMPKDWSWLILEKVCIKIQDGSHFSPQIQYDDPGLDRFKYITAKNIRNNRLDLSNLTYVDRQFHSGIFIRCNPEYGDVLMTKDGVNTGEVTVNTLIEEFSLLSSVCLFKPNKELLNSSYLKYFIQSPFGSKIIEESMTGTAIKRIILKKLRNAKIVLPPLDEQERIVSEIDNRLSVCDKIVDTIYTCCQQTEVLKHSILQQAFEGKLVQPQTN